jgi:hypothetical protein
MKFFDLEMSECLAAGKKGGREVSWAEGFVCNNYKYTNGNDHNSCMANTYKDTTNSNCAGAIEPFTILEK